MLMFRIFLRDVRYACRSLRKSPGFAAAAILTLTLGIGANTAIFSVVEGVLLAPLPYTEPDRLVMVRENNLTLKRQMSVSYPDFLDWQRGARSFTQMAGLRFEGFDLTSPGAPEHLAGQQVSAGFFTMLGTKPILGRDFSPDEDRHLGAPVVIVSNRLWRNRLGASRKAIGQSIALNGVDYAVTGVLPAGFRPIWDSDSDVYLPLGQGDPLIFNDRTIHPGMGCMARLKPGVTIAQAGAEMDAIENRLSQVYPAADRGLGTEVVPLKREIVGDVTRILLMLLGAAGLVLLIACANVANLLLARSTARTREFAIRSALGASRARIASQLLVESVLLSFVGGVLGLVVAIWARPAIAAVTASLPRSENIGVNMPVLSFALAVSVAVGILFGLAPALKSSKTGIDVSLKEGGRGSAGSHRRSQRVLVMVQMALTLVLLTGASLLFRTIHNLWEVDPGFATQHIITFKAGLSPSVTRTASSTRIAYQQLTQRIRQIPGVQAADFTVLVPLTQNANAGPFLVGSEAPASMAMAPRANFYWTGPDYLRTMEIPLLRGRFFNLNDTTRSARVIVIDSTLARTYFQDRDPVGQPITIPYWGVAQVIGVVGHVRHWGMDDANRYTQNQIYASFYQLKDEWVPHFQPDVNIAIRTPLQLAAVMPAIKTVVYGVSGGEPVYNVRTMQEIVSASMTSQRLPMALLGLFAILALLLASVGIYGVISYAMTQRVREIGIRMALGAVKRDVLRMVIGQGLRMALGGIAIGVAAALVLTRVMLSFSQLLYGVPAWDPWTLAAVSLVLIGAALLACYIPARRAARLDPMIALRHE
jgi:predicted permease